MEYIVDIQGFKQPINEFVLKEISIIEVNGDDSNSEPLTLFFKPPSAWNLLPAKYKASNAWLERNFHGMSWNSGNIPYDAVKNIVQAILRQARVIYVKGLEKMLWISTFVELSTEIIDLECLGCTPLRKLPKIAANAGCIHHTFDSKYNCAKANVKSLRVWLKVYQGLCRRNFF